MSILADLQRQAFENSFAGLEMSSAEVGPRTWNYLMDMCEEGTAKKWPKGMKSKTSSGYFMGIRISPNIDVPEGKLWPERGNER